MEFTQVQEIFAEDNGEYEGFLRIIKDDVMEAKEILEDCKTSFSEKAYGDLKHNLISTLRVFSLEDLAVLFEEGKTALDQGDQKGFLAVANQLIEGFNAFEVELVRELGAGA